jgi:tRNA-dihydrouridine synthase B
MKRLLGLAQPLVLSPMVDVTDAAFRSVASDWGADITCSEMVAATGLIHGNQKSWRLVEPFPNESPYGVQLMGSQPEDVAQAAAQVVAAVSPDFIDINLGCPSPNILRSCAGGFMLRDPKLVGRVVRATVEAVGDTPVSVKLRLGHDDAHQTFIDVGREAEAAGASWCTLHGRTVVQGYSGQANWGAIGRLVDALEIPVIGNGDLRTQEDVIRMRDDTGCAGFFIARAAMHDPTIFRRMHEALAGNVVSASPNLQERIASLGTYLHRAAANGDVPLAVLKRQATRFIQGVAGARKMRNAIQTAPDAAGVLRELQTLASLEVSDLNDNQ